LNLLNYKFYDKDKWLHNQIIYDLHWSEKLLDKEIFLSKQELMERKKLIREIIFFIS
jgi:hypothetical protein